MLSLAYTQLPLQAKIGIGLLISDLVRYGKY